MSGNPQTDKIQELESKIRELEEKLRLSDVEIVESRLKRAELASRTGNWELDLDNKIMYGSEGARMLYGLKSSRMSYDDVKSIPLPEYRSVLDKALKDLISGTAPYDLDFRIRNAESGEIIDLHTTAVYDKEKRKVFGVIRDITKQKHNEAQLKKRSENLAIQLRISMDLLEKTDKRSVLVKILEGANSLVGLDTGVVYSIDNEHLVLESTIPPLDDSYPDEFRRALLSDHPHIARALVAKQPVIVRNMPEEELSPQEAVIIQNRDMRTMIFIPLIATGQNYGIIILGSLGKIHELTENEIAICRTLSNVASLAIENSILISNLRAARDKAEESDKLKTAFLHNISHEIRTPLNAIVGFSELMEQHDLKESDRRKFIDIIRQSNVQLLNIINDIFNLSHIEAGQVLIREEKTDIKALINNLYNQFLPVAEKKGLTLKLDITGAEKECCSVISDAGKLIQILSNLINNAIKFTTSGTVTLGCSKQDHRILFYVEDTGIGIPEHEQKKIFERFYQANKTSSGVFSGAGLGLSISDAYVRLLGGEINVESKPGKGSRFSFEIPCIPTGGDGEIINKEYEEVSTLKKMTTIVVAEDESSNARLLELFLRRINAKVLIAENGKEALELCRQNNDIDLVLMDIKMPVMDGYTATEEIKKIRPDLTVIAQTAYTATPDKMRAINAGCSDFISKPINKTDLLNIVEKYLKH